MSGQRVAHMLHLQLYITRWAPLTARFADGGSSSPIIHISETNDCGADHIGSLHHQMTPQKNDSRPAAIHATVIAPSNCTTSSLPATASLNLPINGILTCSFSFQNVFMCSLANALTAVHMMASITCVVMPNLVSSNSNEQNVDNTS